MSSADEGSGDSPPLLCGLLCRFLGTRFVASTRYGMVCQVGAHATSSAVGVRLDFAADTIKFVITVKSQTGSDLVTKFSCSLCSLYAPVDDGRIDAGVVFTASVARWAYPHLVRTTFIQIPRSGLRGCASATAVSIGAAAMCFCGKAGALYHHNTHTATAKGVKVVFWPRHITVDVAGAQGIVHIPDSVVTRRTRFDGRACYLYADGVGTTNNLDEVIVQTCRAMQGCITRVARTTGRATPFARSASRATE
jgi:hypothetical protein